ncbi:M16 family metallopeptidase [Planctomycetota bacterium]
MNTQRFGFVLVCLFLGLPHYVLAQAVKHYTKLEYSPLSDISIPDIRKTTLPNGMRLYLLEDHELPLVHFSAIIRTGSLYEPADKTGLAEITGQVMRTGGTATHTGDELDALLESLAASVETSIGQGSGSASASALTEDVDTILPIFAEVLMSPAFRADKLQLALMQHSSAIARRNDHPSDIADREFTKLIYGSESPYARQTEYHTLASISQQDLIEFHQRFFVPNNVMLAVWGDFESERMIEKINQAFAAWEKRTVNIPNRPTVDYTYPKTVNLIRKPDINQSHITMGHIGGLRSDPDYFALIVANRILGSGFTGRLFKNVRSRLGLAYSVYGYYGAHFAHPGIFYVGCQTKSESTVQAIEAMTAEVFRMTQEDVTEEELAVAKESFLNSFVFNFDTRGEIINRLMIYDYYGYPADFLQRTKRGIESVTQPDVRRVAQQHYHPDKMQILIVGRPGDFDRPLSVLGDVNEIDITIPPPPQMDSD